MRLLLLVAAFLISTPSQAQYVAGGAQFGMSGQCRPAVPRGIKRLNDDIKDAAKEIREKDKILGRAEKELKKRQDKLNKHKANLKSWLKTPPEIDIHQAVVNAMSGTPRVSPEEVCNGNEAAIDATTGAKLALPWEEFCKAGGPTLPNGLVPYSVQSTSWKNIQAQDLCNSPDFYKNKNAIYNKTLARIRPSKEKCVDAIAEIPELSLEVEELDALVKGLEAEIEGLEDMIDELEDEKEIEMDDYYERMAEGRTQGEFCYTCAYGTDHEPTTADRITGLLGPLIAGGAAIGGSYLVARENANAGFPTNPWTTYGMGLPYAMAGIYGAAYGGGGAGLGCGAGNPYGGGAFGYPPGYTNPYGGGVIAPGGFPGYYSPYPGGMFAQGGIYIGGFPAAGGFPGYPGYGTYNGGIFAQGGIYAGGGFPAAGFPAAGFPAAGGIFAQGGIYAGGGFPAAGFPAAGGIYAQGGIYAGGGFPAAGFPAAGGIYAQGGIYAGGGFPAGGLGSQYQLQLMQFQQQQMQQWMVEQQRVQADYQNRSMLVGRLQQDLYRIQMQIQQISVGGYGGGAFGFGGGVGLGSGGGYPTGRVYDPNTARGRGYQGTGPGRPIGF